MEQTLLGGGSGEWAPAKGGERAGGRIDFRGIQIPRRCDVLGVHLLQFTIHRTQNHKSERFSFYAMRETGFLLSSSAKLCIPGKVAVLSCMMHVKTNF